VKFDHDFIGREALEKNGARPAPQEGDAGAEYDDVIRTFGTMFNKSVRAKYFDTPSAVVLHAPVRSGAVRDRNPRASRPWIGYSANEGKMLTLAISTKRSPNPATR